MIDYNINNKEKIFFILFSLHQVIMYFIFYDAFKSYFTYIPLLSVLLFFSFKGRSLVFWFFGFLIFLIFSYSLYSFFNNPFDGYNNSFIKEGEYIIAERHERTRMVGSITSQDKILEPTNYNDLYLEINNGSHFVLKCSMLEGGCPFYNKIGDSVFVKYINIKNVKYSFYIKKKNIVYDNYYFLSKYNEEKNTKLFFIIFYELISIFFILFFCRKGK